MGDLYEDDHIQMLRETLLRFIEKEMPLELVRQWDRDNHFPAEVHRKLADLGLMGLTVPEEHGGGGRDIRATVMAIELLCGRSMAVGGPYIQSACYAGLNLAEVASERQKKELLPRVVNDGMIFAYGISEPDVGADVAAVRSTGRIEDGNVVINGSKRFCSGATIADYIYTLVRTGPKEDKYANLSLVLVPTDAEGIVFEPQDALGLKGTGTYDVTFADVKVPLENVVGEDAGWNQAWKMLVGPGLDIEKIEVAAMALGIASAAVEEAWEYAQEREQFGKPISAFQSIRHMLADARTKLHACRAVTYQAAEQLDRGEPASLETSMAKLFVCDTARDIVLSCQQVLGAYGYIKEFDMERHVRDILIMPILGGSSAIQKNNICNMLKLRK
ncbi:acyl-CoA dehydrogenase [Croceicoccus estronivorus]|uniref:acyl-CoA dehydrogenase family protein n=1 Tax=Croceicoccus estronivorus TaxID=1172626 RepID=UPI00083363A3|nr:acyl-CoA dehydrogenase family protein [Croceicoccus estronivorus]OCC25624.1 acyl-CoA dehydrogenase [Croceicoccus estronivorus]